MREYWDKIVDMATDTSNYATYIIEFILLVVVFWFVFKVFRQNKSNIFTVLFIVIAVAAGFALSFTDSVGGETILLFVCIISLVPFLFYSPEIKRTLLSNSRKQPGQVVTESRVDEIITSFVRSVQSMAKSKTGAIIVFAKGPLPEGIRESGTVINAVISSPMIETVFYHGTPLHDGALVVTGDRLYSAGCFLPVSPNVELPQGLGSRHRAAISITMMADVFAIVVSEETGIISIFRDGKIEKRYAGSADLKNVIGAYYSDALADDKRA